jgi:hypothetical protein
MTQFLTAPYRKKLLEVGVLPKLLPLVRELSMSYNLAILSHSKWDEEREFYLGMATKERESFRELQGQVNGALFERVVRAP